MNTKQKYYLFTASSNIILTFSAGAIVQSFLTYMKLSPEQIGIYTVCINVMQAITLLLSTFFADKVKNVPKTIGALTWPVLLFFAAMTSLCLISGIPANAVCVIAICACLWWNFFYGIRITLEYKLPYYIADIREYPQISNTSGIIQSILGVAVSSLFVFVTGLFAYKSVMVVCFVIAAVFAVVAALTVSSVKSPAGSVPEAPKSGGFSFRLFTLPQTRYLAGANILRGISNGIMGMAAVIMLSNVTEDSAASSSLATFTAVATVISCIAYKRLCRSIKTTKLCIIGGIIESVGLVGMLFGKSGVLQFIICYFIAFAGEVIVDYGIPIFITEFIPYDYIAGYTAIRMALFTVGQALGNYLAGIMAVSHARLLLYICALTQLVNVTWHYLCGRKKF